MNVSTYFGSRQLYVPYSWSRKAGPGYIRHAALPPIIQKLGSAFPITILSAESGRSIIGDLQARKAVFEALRQLKPESTNIRGEFELKEYWVRCNGRNSQSGRFLIEAWVSDLEGVPNTVKFCFDEAWSEVYLVELSNPAIIEKRAEVAVKDAARDAAETAALLQRRSDHYVFVRDWQGPRPERHELSRETWAGALWGLKDVVLKVVDGDNNKRSVIGDPQRLEKARKVLSRLKWDSQDYDDSRPRDVAPELLYEYVRMFRDLPVTATVILYQGGDPGGRVQLSAPPNRNRLYGYFRT
jgi:hypothetical protein